MIWIPTEIYEKLSTRGWKKDKTVFARFPTVQQFMQTHRAGLFEPNEKIYIKTLDQIIHPTNTPYNIDGTYNASPTLQ